MHEVEDLLGEDFGVGLAADEPGGLIGEGMEAAHAVIELSLAFDASGDQGGRQQAVVVPPSVGRIGQQTLLQFARRAFVSSIRAGGRGWVGQRPGSCLGGRLQVPRAGRGLDRSGQADPGQQQGLQRGPRGR